MNIGFLRCLKNSPFLSYAGLLLLLLSNQAFAKQNDVEGSDLSRLTLVELVKQEKGGYSDLFVKLKENPDFLRLSNKHGLDDPAAWPTLKSRFILNLAELQQEMVEAESMIATPDRRSGLSKKLISAEKTREEGRQMKEQLIKDMDELRQLLRLMEEAQTLFEEVAKDHALTGPMEIFNKPGRSFTGQVLFVDANDLIVKREGNGYFRVPANLLSRDTRQTIINQVVSDWDELPFLQEDVDEEVQDGLELVAYNESDLYYINESGGLVFEPLKDHPIDVVTYQTRLEQIGEINSIRNREERESKEKLAEDLEAARLLNQSRAAKIAFYGERLVVQIPESQRDLELLQEEVMAEAEVPEEPETSGKVDAASTETPESEE